MSVRVQMRKPAGSASCAGRSSAHEGGVGSTVVVGRTVGIIDGEPGAGTLSSGDDKDRSDAPGSATQAATSSHGAARAASLKRPILIRHP